jgi:hypothetical protein
LSAEKANPPKLAKGKGRVGYVLPEKQIERIHLLAVKRKVRTSHFVEHLLNLGLKALAEKSEAAAN